MPTVEVDDATFEVLRMLAAYSGVQPSDVIAKLIADLSPGVGPAIPTTPGGIPIHKVYKGVRCDGVFDPRTGTVSIASGPLTGRAFATPSAAAVAVVKAINPGRSNPETNGYRFWKTEGGGYLEPGGGDQE